MAEGRQKLTLDKPQAAEIAPPVAKRVKLYRPHGFIEDGTGRHRQWSAGEIVKDPAEIALLRERGAPIEEIE